MAKKTEQMSTNEFSSLTGIPVTSVAKLLREGKIKGAKRGGKWLISKNQLSVRVVQKMMKSQKSVQSQKESAESQKVPRSNKIALVKAKKGAFRNAKTSVPPEETSVPKRTAFKKTYSVSEFSAMTYLTDFGVMKWLKKGRLKGAKDANGDWRVDAANLELPGIKRLLRD